MKDYSKIDIDDNRAIFDRGRVGSYSSNEISVLVLLVVIFIIAVCVFILEYYDNQYIRTIKSMSRIKKNLNSTSKIVEEAHSNHIRRVSLLKSLRTDIDLNSFQCYDMGTYYIPMKVDSKTSTFIGIRRGKGNFHTVQKVESKDDAAYYFCQYLIQTEEQRQKLGCGKDMFEKLGYSDLLTSNSPCNQIIDVVYQKKGDS